jgi:predicted AlkP superfamily pyrophosphatase or phosphodiesterase
VQEGGSVGAKWPIDMRQIRLLRFPLALGILALALAEAAAAPRARHVFIVSIDGGKPAVMQKSKMPTLFSLIKQGSSTWKAQTIFPSITLVSHTSMLTGVGPEKHGISWNDWKPEKGVVAVPTVFGLARAKGFSTALFTGKEKFQHLNVPGTLKTFSFPAYKAEEVAQVAARYIEVTKPNLCFIHFADADGAGHASGWGSPQQMEALADVDGALGVIYRAIWKAGIARDSVVLISADHGGHDKNHGTSAAEDMTIPWIAWGAGVRRGYTITAGITTYDTAATALWLLDVPIPENWDGKPVTSAFSER